MTAIVRRPKRGRRPTRRPDLSDLKAIIRDRRLWTAIGVVSRFAGESSHYELVQEDGAVVDVLVDVVTQPGQVELSCRLAAAAGGAGLGLWAIPPEGSEVAVVLPDGALDFQPTIVGLLSTGAVPDRVSDERTILVANEVEIIASKVRLGDDPAAVVDALDGFVHGRGIDSFSGATYAALGNTSAKVVGNK